MAGRTRLHPDQAGLEPAKEQQQLRAAKLSAHNHLAVLINAVNLEHTLCHIDSTRCNLHDGLPLARVLDMTNFQSGTSRCRRATAGVHTIALLTDDFHSALRASPGAAKRGR